MAPHIGIPTSRVDGHAKVTGAAKYAAEFTAPDLAHASVVTAAIPKGRIKRIDASDALAVEGVIDVITHENRPKVGKTDKAYMDAVAPGGSPFRPLYDDKIYFSEQPIALVVAEDADIARFAASLLHVEYGKEQHATHLHQHRERAKKIARPTKSRGNADRALAAADTRLEAEYHLPIEHHNPMELFATTVVWEGDGKLTVYDKTQGVQNVQAYLCGVFGMKPDDIRVLSPYVGGAFGSGLRPQYNVMLAVMAALALKRSVRVVLTRPQHYGLGYRPATIEKVSLAAKPDGTLDALAHEAIAMTSQYEDFARNDTAWSELLYKCDHTKYAHKLVPLDVCTPGDMRAPGAASGVYALECAMDELAAALNMDPLELRLRNHSDRDQAEDIPYTSKQLRECYRQGAAAFGWDKRDPKPRSMRDGSDLVGWGMASGVWAALQMPMGVRIALTANGHVEVACAITDIGTGTYTIMAQVAADMLGLPMDNITIKLADSSLPFSPVQGGSWTAASVSNAIANTAEEVRKELLRLAQKIPDSPLAKAKADDVVLTDGMIAAKGDAARAVSIADAMRHGGMDRVVHEKINRFPSSGTHAHNTHSAIFAEVKVDEELGVIRVTRVVSAVAAGRILNPKTAASQIMGGVVWGIGMALHEETVFDHGAGRIVNANYGEYHIPVNADVHDIQVIFVDEPDDLINPLGVKGVGEIGVVGVAAAVANAVYHATGKRVRDLPITLDKLMR